jgi:hypothetical protein
MSGRRAFPRFRTLGAWSGRLRASRQVAVDFTEPGDVLTIISDGPGVVGEELTLGLVKGSEQMVVNVRVIATNPQVRNGVVRHQLTLEVLGTQHAMPIGAIASLIVGIEGRQYTDEVRVLRSQLMAGAGERYELGVEFLWLRLPGEESLRSYAATLTSSPALAIGDARLRHQEDS